ncbi:MAG: hypothetical protein WCP95_01655 [Actinomycetes bacterium]
MTGDRGRRTVVVLTLLTTIVAAVVAGLEVEASTQGDAANRDSERLVLTAAARQVSDTVAEGYQTRLVTEVLANTQQSLALDYAALQQGSAGKTSEAEELGALAAAAHARADQAQALSDIYADPAFAPATPDGFPDVKGYLDARAAGEKDLVAQQNDASDAYNLWNSRSDTYVAILSVLAITFFLLGLAQVAKRMRPFLATCAGGLLVLVIGWSALTAFT